MNISDQLKLEAVRNLSDAIHMAWMRENIKCSTCKWQRRFVQGFDGEELEAVDACGNENGPWYMSPAGERESCAMWEPKL